MRLLEEVGCLMGPREGETVLLEQENTARSTWPLILIIQPDIAADGELIFYFRLLSGPVSALGSDGSG